MVEEQATSVVAWIVKEYKKLKAFKEDATEIGVDAYIVSFIDCKDKVARAYMELHLGSIIANGVGPEEEGEEEEGATNEGNTKIEELVARGWGLKMAATKGPEG